MTTMNVINSTTLDNIDACSLWLESFKSQSTKKSYKIHLLMFCKYHNTDPDSLVRLKIDQIKNMVIEYIVQLKKVAKKYVSKAKRGEICMNSIKTYMMGIQGLSNTMTTGIVSGIDRSVPYGGYLIPNAIQTDAPINPGNSGGPLLDTRGKMIGMNTAILSGTNAFSGIGFAIPSNTITKIVPILIQKGYY